MTHSPAVCGEACYMRKKSETSILRIAKIDLFAHDMRGAADLMGRRRRIRPLDIDC